MPLVNLGENFPIVLTEEKLDQIASSHGISRSSMRLPGPNDTAGTPPEGYMAWSRYHCMCGTIPPLNQWIGTFTNYLRIAPMQLQPNSYAILNSMYVIFMERYKRRPTFREIRFFYNIKNYRRGSPFLNLESAHKNKTVLDLYNKFSMFKKEYFYVKDTAATRHVFCSGGMWFIYFLFL